MHRKIVRQSGFTLIELMIVVGIIGILVMIALPAYMGYVARAQVSEGLQLAASMKPYVEEAYADTGSLPISVTIPKRDSNSGNYVDIVAIDGSGIITAKFKTASSSHIQGKTITLTPSFARKINQNSSSKTTVWSCGGTVDSLYLPATCKN